MQSLFTVGQLGGLHFTTWSGECSTGLAEEVMSSMAGHGSVGDMLFLGYANDYLGYQLQEEDWWHGGYEASGGMWGPRQGEYMKGIQGEVFDHFMDGGDLSFSPPNPLPAFDLSVEQPYSPAEADGFGTVAVQPAASYEPSDTVEFTIQGSDPWSGAPLAVLQHSTSGNFEDVQGTNALPVESDGYGFWVDLAPEPGYGSEPDAQLRAFAWTFSMPLLRRAPGLAEPLSGTYRFRVELPTGDGSIDERFTDAFGLGNGGS
jgi:hypothetical protein